MPNELKPCPFCGEQPKASYSVWCGHVVRCVNRFCFVRPQTRVFFETIGKDTVGVMWNRRQDDPESRKPRGAE